MKNTNYREQHIIINYPIVSCQANDDDELTKVIVTNLKFIRSFYFENIYSFVKEVSNFLSYDYNKIEKLSLVRFKIGEIEYGAKSGNLILILHSREVIKIEHLLRKYFKEFKIVWYTGEHMQIMVELYPY